jgi:Ras GTPase-activating-like protein IQGAP2/3
MSYRHPHPLQQSQTLDYSPGYTKRLPSNASTASSAYSNSSSTFGLSRTSTLSSTASSGYQRMGHKRGISEASPMAPPAPVERSTSRPGSVESSPDYKSVRLSLRPLPQAPAYNQARPESPSYHHSRGHSLDVRHEHHENIYESVTTKRITSSRPNSMILSRSDTINHSGSSSRNSGLGHAIPHTPLLAPDLQSLEKSSTSHLRTLSKFAQSASPR